MSGDQAQIQFGKVPFSVIAGGAIRRMRSADAKVYLAIAAHLNGADWSAAPSIARIADLTGIAERTVRRSIANLREEGLLSVATGGGRSRTNRYSLAFGSGFATTDPAGKPWRPGHCLEVETPTGLSPFTGTP